MMCGRFGEVDISWFLGKYKNIINQIFIQIYKQIDVYLFKIQISLLCYRSRAVGKTVSSNLSSKWERQELVVAFTVLFVVF